MQDINRRLEKDTAKLLAEKENEDKKIEEEEKKVKLVRERNLKNRKQAKKEKEEWLGKKKEAIDTTEHQREDAGKLSWSAITYLTDTFSPFESCRWQNQGFESIVRSSNWA